MTYIEVIAGADLIRPRLGRIVPRWLLPRSGGIPCSREIVCSDAVEELGDRTVSHRMDFLPPHPIMLVLASIGTGEQPIELTLAGVVGDHIHVVGEKLTALSACAVGVAGSVPELARAQIVEASRVEIAVVGDRILVRGKRPRHRPRRAEAVEEQAQRERARGWRWQDDGVVLEPFPEKVPDGGFGGRDMDARSA